MMRCPRSRLAATSLLWAVAAISAADGAGMPTDVTVIKIMAGGVAYPVVPLPGDQASPSQAVSTELALAPIRVPLSDLPLNLTFGAVTPAAKIPIRIRYRLGGWDERWKDMPGAMWLVLRFLDESGRAISSASFQRFGESGGWRGEIPRSEFHATADFAVVPERTRSAQLLLVSGGTPRTTGVWVVRRLKLSVVSQENSTEAGSTLLDIAALSGAQLDSPRGVPDDWTRDGTGLGTPQLLSAGSPAAPMLALVDTDPTHTGGWLARGRNVVLVEPGTALRIDCEEFYSLGRGGEFTESYLNLRAEHYTFVVHAVDEFGRETDSGVRLPITIVPPLTQTLWFRGLGAGAFLLASGHRFRLMMVVKEALTNVLRHAGATEVKIRLALAGETLAVTLRDDGGGFGEPGKAGRNGIANMHERMREIGGTCEIASVPGGGTTVELRLPLKEAGA